MTPVQEQLYKYMQMLRVASKHQLSKLMTQWSEGASRINNTKKTLDAICPPLEQLKGFYRLNSQSEFSPHAQKLTDDLIQVLMVEGEVTIHREITIPEINLRPDSIIFISRGDRALCFILETCLTEKEEYTEMKERTFKEWPDKLKFLSDLFHYPVPQYDFVANKGTELDQYIKEVIGC